MANFTPRGIRTRLLAIIGISVAIAVALITIAFNAVLRHSLDGDATSLAHGRAAAALSTIQVSAGRISVAEAPDDGAIDAQIWIFDGNGRVEAPPSTSQAVERAATALAGGPARIIDARGTRLYATPIVKDGVRAGTLVAGVGLRPYRQTARSALLGSIAFAVLLFAIVVAASRWLLRHALQPVAEMTRAVTDWSEHAPTRRFARGRPHDELTSLAATLDGLLDRVASSLRREQRFSAEMSHELRTPLARIHAESEFALSRARTLAEHREAHESVARSARQMTRTVDALLAAARQETAIRGSSNIREGVDRAIEATRPLDTDAGAALRFEAPRAAISVAVDQDVVERIVAPLIENARRHATADAAVTVSRDGSSVLITVVDDGAGISPLELERVFQPGARGTAAPVTEGAGLGLALARRLARAAGGDITAQPGPGGRFTVRLPAT